MLEQKIKINKNYNYIDNTNLEIYFLGSIDSSINLDKEELMNRLDNIFKSRTTTPNILEATTIIRTILKDIKETNLEIAIGKENNFIIQIASYINTKLKSYYHHKYPTSNDISELEVEYNDAKQGIKFLNNDKNNEQLNNQDNIRVFTQELDIISKLQTIKPRTISRNEKIICTIYRLFYNENPDFNKNEDKIKTQLMLAFLTDFGISLFYDTNEYSYYDFKINTDKTIVLSYELSSLLNQLAPLGLIINKFEDIKITKEYENIIKVVGKEIRNQMLKKEKPVEWFKDLVIINYIKQYCMPSNSEYKEIAQYCNKSKNIVNNSLTLVKKINNQVKELND